MNCSVVEEVVMQILNFDDESNEDLEESDDEHLR